MASLTCKKMSTDDLNNITYFANSAAQKDYDMSTGGWTGDYQDPSTYLGYLNIKNGGSLQNFGFEPGQIMIRLKSWPNIPRCWKVSQC